MPRKMTVRRQTGIIHLKEGTLPRIIGWNTRENPLFELLYQWLHGDTTWITLQYLEPYITQRYVIWPDRTILKIYCTGCFNYNGVETHQPHNGDVQEWSLKFTDIGTVMKFNSMPEKVLPVSQENQMRLPPIVVEPPKNKKKKIKT